MLERPHVHQSGTVHFVSLPRSGPVGCGPVPATGLTLPSSEAACFERVWKRPQGLDYNLQGLLPLSLLIRTLPGKKRSITYLPTYLLN